MGRKQPSAAKARSTTWKKVALYVALFAAVMLIIGFQFDNAAQSIGALRGARVNYVLLAVAAIALSYCIAALTYQLLTWPLLRFSPTLMVQIATGLTNRLLPAGLGSMGLYATYLHARGKSIAASTAIVASNNFFGIIGNLLLLSGVLILHPSYISRLEQTRISPTVYIGIAAGLIVVGVGALIYLRRRTGNAMKFIRNLLVTFRITLRPSRRALAGLLGNMTNTALNVWALSLVVSAVGGTLSWPDALLVLSLGAGVGAVVPTPGGIGGVEAGLFAGLLAFGLTAPVALAAVLLYRALAYWLPIVPGAVILRIVERRYLKI